MIRDINWAISAWKAKVSTSAAIFVEFFLSAGGEVSVGGSPVRAAICCECVVCASKDRRRLCGTAAALRGAVGPICLGKRRDLFGAKADATATRRRHRFWPWKLPRRCRTGVGTAQQRWLGLRLSRDAVRTEQKLDVAGVSEDHRTGDAHRVLEWTDL